MKKFIWLFGVVLMFTLTNCGSGTSSKEGKELLQKILQVVGIPQEIVINICQDGNENGICESFELQTKITLSKGDTLDDILNKIQLTEDGKYFLETRDPKKPILLELQDKDNVYYNDGKFTLPFDGFQTYENNEKKELSILTSMVDNGFLNEGDIAKIRDLNNSDAQNRFYAVLLSSLEKNINTLSEAGLDIKNVVLADLREMSIGLIQDGIGDRLPEDLNNCGTDMSCVDNRLRVVETKTTITSEQAQIIKNSYISNSENNDSSNSTPSSGQKMLLSKETEVTKYYYNGSLRSEETSVTTYKYDGTKLISTQDSDGENCTIKYDSKERYLGDSCIDTDGSTSKVEIVYNGDKIVEQRDYNDGELDTSWKVLEWSGNRASKIEVRTYGEEVVKTTITIKYSRNNPREIRMLNDNENINSDENILESVKITREFDNKKSPYWNFKKIFLLWYFGENNILKEITEYKTNKGVTTSTTINKIDYNSADFPIRIEATEEVNSYLSDFNSKTITITTYEYMEVK